MKYLMILLVVIAVAVGFYEQGKEQPNLYILCGAIVVFMVAAMRIGSKIPSNKHKEDNHGSVQ